MDFTRCFSCMGELDRPGGRCPHCGYDNATAAKTQSSHALPCGTLLHGRYVVGKMLGQGGFGVTYIGWDLAMSQRICVKEYFPAGAAMRDAAKSATVTWSGGESAEELKRGRESFIREARKAVKLRKLNAVVQVWDVFYENDTAYLIMDYIEGVTLKSHLMETRRPLSEEECVRLLAPVMRDLEEAHARGIIHRDISPDNLMLQPDGSLVLLDIGAAKDLSGGSGQSSVLVAKKGFSPLEQYASGGNIGPWTDVYALCATIAYCVTGKLLPSPMDRLTGAELDLSAFSSAIAEVLQRGLAIRPEERIQSMRELLAAYEDAAKPGRGSWSEGEADPTAETKQEAVSTLGSSAARKKGSARRVLVPIAAVAILLL
ncbi:MAG: serine/threonine protein kinase, partial [Selenomonadaceae bacterium]|nr:serine/threonine protein kinase [Selenomonadaceae bacterium]